MSSVAKENQKIKRISEELKGHIKDFFRQGLTVTEVATKLNVPYHVAYSYSNLNKKRKKARAKSRQLPAKVKKDVYADVIESKIAELEAEKEKLDLQIETLKGLL